MPAQTPDVELVSPGDGLVRRLRELAGDAQRADALAPVTIVTPSYYSSYFLGRALAQAAARADAEHRPEQAGPGHPGRGLFNVEFRRIEDVADMLARAGQGASEPEKRPISSLVAGALVFDAGQALPADGVLAPVRGHRSFHRALHRTVDDLRAAGLTPGELPVQDPHVREIAAAAREYERLARERDFEDRADVAARAAAHLANAGLLPRMGTVIVLLAKMPAPQYRVLYRALLGVPGLKALVCVTGNAAADAPVLEFAGAGARDAVPATVPSRTVISAPNPAAEARWVAANILSLARVEGVRFGEIAVLYADRAYGPRLEEALRSAGIPVSGPASSRPADWPEGRFITGLLDALKPDAESGALSLSRDAVTGWLTSAPVRDPATGLPASAANWDAISRVAGVTGGVENWTRRLEAHRSRLARKAQRAPLDEEEGGEMGGRAAEAEAESARALLDFMRRLAAKGQLPVPGGWREYVVWVRGLMSTFLLPAPPNDRASTRRQEHIGLILSRMEEPGTLGLDPPSFARFTQVLGDELDRPAGRSGSLGGGVFLAHYREAAGAAFQAVHVAGMSEGSFHAADDPDPLLHDPVRARLNEELARRSRAERGRPGERLELREHRRAAQLLELEAAVESGQRWFFSWPRGVAGAAREAGPSEWLLQQARAATGKGDLQSRDLRTSVPGFIWLDREVRVLSPAGSQAAQGIAQAAGWSAESAADSHWHDVLSVALWARSGRYGDHPLVRDPGGPVTRARLLEKSRFSGAWTEWDGNLTGAVRRRDSPEFPVASPTRYQDWAECPFRYFLGYELEVAPTERPEELLELTPAERGTLVHAVLEKFVTARKDAPGATAANEQALLEAVASQEFDRFAREERTGHAALWEIEKRSLLRSLRGWLSQDAAARSQSGAAPTYVELEFGAGGAAPAVELDLPGGARLVFRGKIDRVDLSPDGRVFVYDYKTGRPDRYNGLDKDVTRKGTLLQLPVYALAARQAAEQQGLNAQSVSAAYWPVLRTAALELKPPPGKFSEKDAASRLREAAGVIASGVSLGVFPARPGKERSGEGVPGAPFENCAFCRYDRVCVAPARRAWLWERKRGSNGALAPYVRLAEGDGGPDGEEANA